MFTPTFHSFGAYPDTYGICAIVASKSAVTLFKAQVLEWLNVHPDFPAEVRSFFFFQPSMYSEVVSISSGGLMCALESYLRCWRNSLTYGSVS